MTMDRRYPWLRRIESAPLDPADRALARRVQRAVEGRTGASVCFDVRDRTLYMYLGDPSRGITRLPMPGPSHPPIRDGDIDAAVEYIQLGTMPAERKDRMLERQQKAEKDRAAEETRRELDARRPDAKDFVARRRNRRGMGKHYRPSAVVNGMAGSGKGGGA